MAACRAKLVDTCRLEPIYWLVCRVLTEVKSPRTRANLGIRSAVRFYLRGFSGMACSGELWSGTFE
jgi:hypothetical protein